MSRTLLVGTQNPDKVKEITAFLEGLPLRLISGRDVALSFVDEDAPTLEGNAVKKALGWADETGQLTLADDTGLEVDALGGEPGVRSARWAGRQADYAANNAKLLAELAGVPPELRTARFHTVIACALPGRLLFTAEGECRGRIGRAPRGEGGFGYDPLFLVEGLGRTYAELTLEEKNRLSHRARALAGFREKLLAWLAGEPTGW